MKNWFQKIAESVDNLLRKAYADKWQELQHYINEVRRQYVDARDMLEEIIRLRQNFIDWMKFQFNYIQDEKFALVWSSTKRQQEKKMREEERQIEELERSNSNG